jgi:hypothetical protein
MFLYGNLLNHLLFWAKIQSYFAKQRFALHFCVTSVILDIFRNHLDEFNYLNDLKNNLQYPEFVRQSKHRKNTKLVYIKLNAKKHSLLCAVIRYGSFFSRLLGRKNYIVTFYGTDKPKKGRTLWKK